MKETAHYGLSQYETEHDKFRIISGERNLNTDMQIIDAVLHGHAMSLAAEYDEQRTYVRNDFCLHNDSLLRYTGRGLQYSGPHEWIPEEWTPATVEEMIITLLQDERYGQVNPEYGACGYIGRKAEGGGTIIFDRLLGFKGDVTVEPERIEEFRNAYSIDQNTGVVRTANNNPDIAMRRFLVVNDFDIGDAGNPLAWCAEIGNSVCMGNGQIKNTFGNGAANTQFLLDRAQNDGLLSYNTEKERQTIWYYINEINPDDGNEVHPVTWFLPNSAEMTVLKNMCGDIGTKRRGYDEHSRGWSIEIPRLAATLWPYYYVSNAPLILSFGSVMKMTGTSTELINDSPLAPAESVKLRLMRWF